MNSFSPFDNVMSRPFARHAGLQVLSLLWYPRTTISVPIWIVFLLMPARSSVLGVPPSTIQDIEKRFQVR